MKRFHFKLDPLLRKHAWDVDMLSTEKATASRAVEAQHEQLFSIHEQIIACRNSLVGSSVEKADINIAQRQVIEIYIRHQMQLEKTARASLAKAMEIEQQIADHLLLASKQLKTLERLKDHAKQQHAYFELRAELTEADENWLSRRHRI
jgi:flagellar biosynthesis chaperone FliJ